MKILCLATSVNPNSHEASRSHAFAIAHELQRIGGNSVCLVTGGDKEERIQEDGLAILTLRQSSLAADVAFYSKTWRSFRNAISAAMSFRTLAPLRPDVVYERHSIGSLVGIGLSRLAKVPLVFEVNGIPDQEILVDLSLSSATIARLLFGIAKHHLTQADAIIVQSSELKEAICSRFALDNRKIHIVPNGAYPCSIAAAQQDRNKTRRPAICFISKLDGIHDLSDLLNQLRSLDNDFSLRIIGEGRKRDDYARIVSGDTRFTFTGSLSHEHALQELRDADMCIAAFNRHYPLFVEHGFYLSPLKIFEYLAYGKPCVYFGPMNALLCRLHAMKAIIATQEIYEFGKAVKTLLESADARLDLASNARAASREYTWYSSASKTMKVIESVT